MADGLSVDVGILLIIVVTASLTSGSLSVSQRQDVSAEVSLGDPPHRVILPSGSEGQDRPARDPLTARRGRAKRCTCYTYKDKECVYYCHLDIIWINTPEHTVPYGMASSPGSLRKKRSVRTAQSSRSSRSSAASRRCACMLHTDSECSRFCTNRQKRRPPAAPNAKKRTPPFHRGDREWTLK
ncbi:endothelin-3 [Poecilia formosa]|uniref:endothelin-3 n=1 Tax=Poecilia formosa TaxID=48698 RepID=UPI0004448A09|nr:PREDICTED: endothelin-3-like [Poecilia formosa]